MGNEKNETKSQFIKKWPITLPEREERISTLMMKLEGSIWFTQAVVAHQTRISPDQLSVKDKKMREFILDSITCMSCI